MDGHYIGGISVLDTKETLYVKLPHGGGYALLIGWDCLSRAGDFLRQYSLEGEVFVLSDKKVWDLYGKAFSDGLSASEYGIIDTLLIEPGEESKTLDNWRAALDRLVSLEDGSIQRMFLVNLGGGVVGDLGGFVAAAYRRGIPFVQVPTTLLAQVDSSVGGKTGVNHPGGKNLIGAFNQPALVVMDLKTLATLPEREVRSGMMEVVKYGLIWDASLFAYLEQDSSHIISLNEKALRYIVRRSCEIKAEVVSRDEREEKGLRTLLNLGHTFGHALEAATDYKQYTHGEAVGIGILCAARLSVSLEMLSEQAYDRIKALLEKLGAETRARSVSAEKILTAMKRDKKFIHGQNRFVLLEEIGRARVVEGIDLSLISQALEAHI